MLAIKVGLLEVHLAINHNGTPQFYTMWGHLKWHISRAFKRTHVHLDHRTCVDTRLMYEFKNVLAKENIFNSCFTKTTIG